MNGLGNISIELMGVGRAFRNKKLAVPIYQRSYAWEDKHVNDLFSDIDNAIRNNENEYFIGTIVTTKKTVNRIEVVDGQQRLATAAILIAAIRDHFFFLGDEDRANEIASTYLRTKDLNTLDVIPRIQMNSSDNDFFVKRILSDANTDRGIAATKDSHRKIERAAKISHDHVKYLITSGDAIKTLVERILFIEERLKVIWVEVPDDSNAFTIFETLNDRGLDLAISDLLKNYLFGLAGDRIAEVQQRWVSMTATIEAIDKENLITTFIRHLWSSKFGITRERELYVEIKKKIRNKTQAIAFATELSDSARIYAAILNQDHELWQKYGPTAKQHMATLNDLQMIQIRPLVLAVLEKVSVKEAQKILRLMVSWAVRFLIYGGLGGGVLETNYSSCAKDVRSNLIKSAKKLRESLASILPTDAEFRDAFASASVSKNSLARYYLRALEKQHKGQKDPELIVTDNTDVVNLEHVLPQNASAVWDKSFSEDEKELYVKRLGNMALLNKRINTDLGNDSFKYKKAYYKKSRILLTSKLATYLDWNAKYIVDRQKKLADLAVKTWPLK